MHALYAFMRLTDDLADQNAPVETRQHALGQWRDMLDDALAGRYDHPIHAALHQVVRDYHIPSKYLHDVIDGVEMDLHPLAFETFNELYRYCYRVASAVGLCCIHIWGFRDASALQYAEAAGIAFQLTNILRDLGEDARIGRLYLPGEDLSRFQVDPASWESERMGEPFQMMMRFQVARARHFYQKSAPLTGLLAPSGAAIYHVMSSAYRSLIDTIEARGYDVFRERVRVSRRRKIGLLLATLPIRWGWR